MRHFHYAFNSMVYRMMFGLFYQFSQTTAPAQGARPGDDGCCTPHRGMLREQEARLTTAEVFRRHGLSSATFYAWTSKYDGMDVSGAKRLKAVEE
jgi:hypothetical protein